MLRYVIHSKFLRRKWKPEKTPKYGYANREHAVGMMHEMSGDYPRYSFKIVEEEHPDKLFENGKYNNIYWGR